MKGRFVGGGKRWERGRRGWLEGWGPTRETEISSDAGKDRKREREGRAE